MLTGIIFTLLLLTSLFSLYFGIKPHKCFVLDLCVVFLRVPLRANKDE